MPNRIRFLVVIVVHQSSQTSDVDFSHPVLTPKTFMLNSVAPLALEAMT
jgi:hypothetical protein